MQPNATNPDRMGNSEQSVPTIVEHLFRHESGRLVSNLARSIGLARLDLAEEAVQDALIQALRRWPFHGIPQNPTGWLAQVARNRVIDILRRQTNFEKKKEDFAHARMPELPRETDLGDDELADDQLAMIFACCHPLIPRDARIALTLKSVGGFSVEEIAKAFFAAPTAIAQRLVRAKKRIKEKGISLSLPDIEEKTGRLDTVLRVLYLIFNEGYTAHSGDRLIRRDLCAEAIRLTSLLSTRAETNGPKTQALLALLLLQAARFPGREDESGELLLLDDQDRNRWDRELIRRGLFHLGESACGDDLSEYHLQAGLASLHVTAPSVDAVDWKAVLWHYDRLLAISHSPVVALNRVVALSRIEGPAAGLQALAQIENSKALQNYYLLPSTKGDLLRRLGQPAEAAEEFKRALATGCSTPEMRFLQRRLQECSADG
ncbi:MAG: sigma-70 family RNA polymerase sigma factor [Pirellulales bacterium]|nr:sigma-70 family RNA polymerase sigma factor [Pirellulales bacterium]